MKTPSKFLVVVLGTPVLLLMFFASNIYGYFRFKSYCANEGGLRVYEKLERNVGWMADDYDSAHMAAQLEYVEFVRYFDKKDGNTYDLRYLGGDPQDDTSFEKKIADESKNIKYVWEDISESVVEEIRLQKYGERILNFKNKKILASYYVFGYEKFDGAHTILGGSTEEYCFNYPAGSINELDGWILALNTAFTN